MELDTRSQLLQLAARNNAAWCELVCRSHNVPGEFHETCWASRQQTPIYYPNLVTLSPTADLQSLQQDFADLLIEKQDYTVSVKDSFAVLDLTSCGLRQLFQAQWIAKEAAAELSRPGTDDLQWGKIASEKELLRWEEAWSQGEASTDRLFLPALLHDPDISFLVVHEENRIVAGAIANRTESVVGISNIFTPEEGVERYWEVLLGQVSALYPGRTIVGYEQDDSLSTALSLGFTILGPLRVWIK